MNRQEQAEFISKFAKETHALIEAENKVSLSKLQQVSKMANEVDAYALDSGSKTVDMKFTELIRLVKPVTPLEEKGIVRVQEVEPQTDKAVFSVLAQQSFTWTAYDTRGSETTTLAAGSGSYQSFTAPAYVEITPLGYTNTLFIHDNIRLVNPVRMAEIMAQVTEEIKSAKEQAAITTLTTSGNYTASVSIKQASGYTALPSGSYVTTGSVLTFSDLIAAKKDLKTSSNRKIKPDVVLVATEQYYDLSTSSDIAPGQTSNGYYKMARFEDGALVEFDKMEIIESQQMAQITTGYFASASGHYAIVGMKNLIVGRGEHTSQNKVETFRDPKAHGTEITTNVSYATSLLFPKAVRAIACADT